MILNSLCPCAHAQGFLLFLAGRKVKKKMSKNLEIKKQAVAEIVEKFKNAQSMVVCSFNGLNVEQVTELRKQCREKNVQYCVLKNRLVLRAMQELGITGLENLMEGPNAFVFGTGDVTDAPKVINQFIEKNKLQSLEIKGGLMGEEVLDAKGVKAIAALPGREELLATLVGCLVSPISSLVAVLDEIAEKKEAA